MISIKNLSYKYPTRNKKHLFEIRDISFHIEDGYFFVLLGKNGAGKTTLLKLLYGMLTPQSGEIESGEESLKNWHNKAAYIGQDPWCISSKSIRDNIDLFRELYPEFDEKQYEENLRLFGLKDEDQKKIYSALSTGQQMQFQMSFMLARHPKVLIMDEPFANLDPVIKEDLMEVLRQKMAKEDMTIIMSTHLLEDISFTADYFIFMERGCILEMGNTEEIQDKYGMTDIKEIYMKAVGKLL